MPDLYLALDLGCDFPQRAVELPFGIDQWPTQKLMLSKLFDGPGWSRTWRAFKDRDEAIAHQKAHPTLVLIPLNAEIIDVAQME